jgi:dihydrofolate reductase
MAPNPGRGTIAVPVAKLIYSTLASLDGYTKDEDGRFDWAKPDKEVHSFFNDLERSVGTHLYGRRMYETMVYWEGPEAMEGQPPFIRDFAAIWRAAEKVVYSRTLEAPSSARTRIERSFDAEEVRRMKDEAERDLAIGGPELAAQAIEAGLVDELHLCLVPVAVGGGTPALPAGRRVDLELLDERRFANGTVYLRHRLDLPSASPGTLAVPADTGLERA